MHDRPFTEHSFQQFLQEHKLMGSRCEACGEVYLPPRPLCPACFSEQMAWVEMGSEGTLAAVTAVYIAPTAMIEAGYGRTNPYYTGVVQLNDGPKISAQILGLESPQIGVSLTAAYIARGEEEEKRTFLAFQA